VVLVEVVDGDVRHKRRLHPFAGKQVPVELSEPGVAFQLLNAVLGAQAVVWIPLQAFVDEVGRLDRPPFLNFKTFNLNLSARDLVPNFFATAADVGPSPLHALVGNDPHGKYI